MLFRQRAGLVCVFGVLMGHAPAAPQLVTIAIESPDPVIWAGLRADQLDASGRDLGAVQVAEGSRRLTLRVEPGAVVVQLSSPFYSAFKIAIDDGKGSYTCRLVRKVRIAPFGDATALVWLRRAPGSLFLRLPEFPKEFGGGFAGEETTADVVAVEKGRCASMALRAPVGAEFRLTRALTENRRPSSVAARLVTSSRQSITETPTIEVIDPARTPGAEQPAPVDPELAAWREFYRSEGVHQSKDGVLTLDPVPCRPLWFFARIPHRRFATLSTTHDGSGLYYAGEIELPELARLRVSVQPPPSQQAENLSLTGSLISPAEALPRPGPLARTFKQQVDPGAAYQRLEVYPGRWLLALRDASGSVLGERQVDLREGGDGEASFSTVTRSIAGVVVDGADHPVAGATLEAYFLSAPTDRIAVASSDENGHFSTEIEYGGGSLVLTISPLSGSHLIRSLDAEADWGHLRLRLSRGSVRVLLRDKLTGKPVEGVPVSLVLSRREDSTRADSRSDTDGVAVFTDLDFGEVRVLSAGSKDWQADPGDLERTTPLTESRAKVEFEVPLHRAQELAVTLEAAGGGPVNGLVFGPIGSGGNAFPAAWATDGTGVAHVIRPTDSVGSSLFVAWAPNYRLTFFEVGPDKSEYAASISPIRLASAVEVSVPESEFRGGVGIVVATHSTLLQGNVLSILMTRAGCSLLVPPEPGMLRFDRCLGDDSYFLGAFEALTRESLRVSPSQVTLHDGDTVKVVVDRPQRK